MPWIRIIALCLLPLAAGAGLAGWERLRRRTGDGRGRAAFLAGLALGVGYVAIRVALLHRGA